MASSTTLTTEQGLKAYLAARSIFPTEITLLTGGTANFVYRVTFHDGKTLIYKHAAPYLYSNHSFAFDPIRMDYENLALSILPPLLSAQHPHSKVHAAKWCSYDKSAKLLCIEDGGTRNLKTAYSDPSLSIPDIGQELAKWLAALHLCSTTTSLSISSSSQDVKSADNNPVAINIYRYAYQGLSGALEQYGHDASFGIRINEEFGSKLATENECVCHGDFWPGNVLVKFKSSNLDVDLSIVDWEMVRRGTSATDVGQLAAEAFLLDRFRGGRGLLATFLNAYVEAKERGGGKIGGEWVKRMAVHWGVHVAFWPTRVEWADRDETRKLVDVGVGVLKAAVEGDFERLRASELLKDVGGVWQEIFTRV